MANYIGNVLQSGEFKKLDEITSLFDGVATEFALKFNGVPLQIGDATQLIVSINGVIQEPLVSYTLGTGGSNIVFFTAPPVGAAGFITMFGGIGATTTPSDNSVTTEKLVQSIQDTLSNVALKANSADVYTKTQSDTALGLKANQSSTYTKTEVDNLLIPANISDKNNTSTGYLDLPSGTTAQRPTSPTPGMARFNTTDNKFEVYDGSSWMQMKPTFVASGGTFTQSGGYNYHAFTSSGTFTITTGSNSVEVLVVAGGGGGGHDLGGGGGAGGLIYNSAYSLTPGTYSVTIGGGGANSGTTNVNGTNGGNSVFGSLTAIGGGGGGSYSAPTTGSSGGSGGGGGSTTGSGSVAGGSGTVGQGNAGGAGIRGLSDGGYGITGGGGGAGQIGFDGNNQNGKGGNGLQYSQFASWGSPSGWFAGGGGGSSDSGGAIGGGGSGGGGSGAGVAGTANTGGGGAGANLTSGAGGSGIVIIRYPT